MSDTPSDRWSSPAEVEADLERRLAGKRLICEVGLEDAELDEIRRIWHGWRSGDRWSPGAISGQYPLIHAAFLVDYGICHYEGHDFWTALRVSPADQRRIGEGFESALIDHGLETFPQFFTPTERARRFVSVILAHGGIPASLAEPLVRQALLPALRDGAETGADLVASWRSDPPAVFTRPVARFLREGGETAIDLLDRLIELAWTPPASMAEVAARLKLPRHLADAVMAAPTTELARTGVLLPRARVTIDPYAGTGPQLVLPPLEREVAPRVSWLVDSGYGQPRELAGFHRAQADPIPLSPVEGFWTATPVLDGRPARTDRFECFALNPVVCFDEGWSYTPDYAGLRLERIWIVAKGDVAYASVEASDELRPLSGVREELSGPWRGYAATRLDLAGVTTLVVRAGGAEACRLAVRAAASEPRLVETPLRDVLGQRGEPVYATLPRVLLPAGHPWSIQLTNPDGVVNEVAFEAAGQPRSLALDELTRPAVGRYEVTVQGALGIGARIALALVPGLTLTGPATPVGPPERDVRIEARAAHEVGLHGRPLGQAAEVVVPAGDSREELWARDRTGKTGLFVSAPRIRWALRAEGGADPLTQTPIRLVPDEITGSDRQAIVVSTTWQDVPVSLVVEAAGRQIQCEGPRRTGQTGQAVFPLDDLRDAIRLHAADEVRLLVLVGAQRIEIGRHQPPPPARRSLVGTTVEARVSRVRDRVVEVGGDGWQGVIHADKLPGPVGDVRDGQVLRAYVCGESERGLRLDARPFEPSRFPNGHEVTAVVSNASADGVSVAVDGHDGFLLPSKLPPDRPSTSWRAGDRLTAHVIGVNKGRRHILLSMVQFNDRGLRRGVQVNAQVTAVSGDRIFVDIDGTPGFIPISAWGHGPPATRGEGVEGWVEGIRRDRELVELTCLPFNPLALKPGDHVEVLPVAQHGQRLIVAIDGGGNGIVPFRELPPHWKPDDLIRDKENCRAVITKVEPESRTIVLSISRAISTYTFGDRTDEGDNPFSVLRGRVASRRS